MLKGQTVRITDVINFFVDEDNNITCLHHEIPVAYWKRGTPANEVMAFHDWNTPETIDTILFFKERVRFALSA